MIASSRSTPCTAKKTFEIARETGNELIVQVKGNQPGLLQHCEDAAATSAPIATAASRDLARNRQEDRRVEVYVPGAALYGSERLSFWSSVLSGPRRRVPDDGVEDCEQLTQAGDDGDLFWSSSRDEALIDGLDQRVVSDGDEGGHV